MRFFFFEPKHLAPPTDRSFFVRPTIPLQNKFFITCLDSVFKYKIQELGGVRVITH